MPDIDIKALLPVFCGVLAALVLSRKPPLQWRWPIAGGLVVVGLFGSFAIDLVQRSPFHEDDLIAVQAGGRVEVPDAGFALTLPEDWRYLHPTREQEGWLLEQVRENDSELAALAEPGWDEAPMSLVALAPAGAGATYQENCVVFVEPAYGLSLDYYIESALASMEPAGRIASGPDVTWLELPTGRVARIDVGWDHPDLTDDEQSMYLFSDGTTLCSLCCSARSRPADAWLPIAESFELLSTVETRPAASPLVAGD